MTGWINKAFDLKEMSRLYADQSGKWLLLDILETDENDAPIRFRLLAIGSDKDALYDYILEDNSWDWDKQYMFVLADPTRPCIL